jgi:hypothetical protein
VGDRGGSPGILIATTDHLRLGPLVQDHELVGGLC